MKISIIVTVFNKSRSQLLECLDSVRSQTLRSNEYEVIVVDDCSSLDETIATINEFARREPAIQVVRHKKNIGPNESRRTGVKHASGDFVLFVDGDDMLSSDAVESLRMQALRTGADIVVAPFFRWNDFNNSYSKLDYPGYSFPQDRVERLRMLISAKQSWTLCGRLFRRALLSEDLFSLPLHTLHEDIIVCTRAMFRAEQVASINRHVYYYRIAPGSITTAMTQSHIDGILLAISDWREEAAHACLGAELAEAIETGAQKVIHLAVHRAVYSAVGDYDSVYALLNYFWARLNTLGFSPFLVSNQPGIQLLKELFSPDRAYDSVHLVSLLAKYNLTARPVGYDRNAILPLGLQPSDIAQRLKDRIVIICQVNYHFRNAAMMAKGLALRGFPCVVVDNSKFAAGGKRLVSAEDRRMLWRTQYLTIEEAPYGSDWLCTARLVITFNDFNDDFREALEYRTRLGRRSVSVVEGINDFLRIDFDTPRYLPYRRCDTVFLSGEHDVQYFRDRTTYVVGLPVVEQLANKEPKFPSKPLAVLNVNFTYGVLEDSRDAFVACARRAFEKVGWDWVITQHPMDTGKLAGHPVSKQTQYELIDDCTVFVSRFATGILEALASGKPVIYFNPHGEKISKFKEPLGAYDIATNTDQLVTALSKAQADLAAGVDFRLRAQSFLSQHTGYKPGGPTTAERFADAVVEIVESDAKPNRRVTELFFDRLEVRDHFRQNAPGLVFGDLDRRHFAQLEETDLVARYFGNRGRLMIDVGANIGQSADTFLGKGWTVHAFEPDPKNFNRLCEVSSHWPTLHINALAVSSKSGEKVAFYASDESTGISSMSPFTEGHKFLCEVETVSLADYCLKYQIDHVDFLKIDVEGHDKFVLDGFNWAKDKPEVVSVEFEDAKTLRNGYSTHDLARQLITLGYSVYVSEWMPIERYGLAHDWRRLIRYSSALNLERGWGNLIGFLNDPGETALGNLAQEAIKFSPAPPHRAREAAKQERLAQLPATDVFKELNKRLRSGDFRASLQGYLNLYRDRPLSIYKINALWAAKKLGHLDCESIKTLSSKNGDDWLKEVGIN
jgi:FkbM family methyltransferase